MKILYCIFSLEPPGGMQRVLTTKANYWADQAGYTVHIVTESKSGTVPYFRLSDRVMIHHFDDHYKSRLSKLLYELRPQVAISLFGKEYKFLYKIKDGSKKIVEFHFTKNHLLHLIRGIPDLRFRSLHLFYVWLLQLQEKWYASKYDKLVLLTDADRLLWGKPANAISIPNPLSFQSGRKSALNAKRVIAAGRFIATKGFDILITSFKPIAVKYPDWRLTIFGEGQDRDYLIDLISEYDLINNVELLPPAKDMRQELLESSMYAFSSRYDGFGLVITEAMECGVPCIAFNCECGPAEIIADGEDGLLVEAQNGKQFSDAMLQLVESGELRIKLAEGGLRTVARFRLQHIMPRWEDLFKELAHA